MKKTIVPILIVVILAAVGLVIFSKSDSNKIAQQTSNDSDAQSTQMNSGNTVQQPVNTSVQNQTPKPSAPVQNQPKPNTTTVQKPSEQKPAQVQAYINITDASGKPFKPTRVWWYYPPVNGNQTTEYLAKCVNQACTRWSMSGATSTNIYVAANYSNEPQGASCFSMAYDAKPVTLSSVAAEVTLVLEPGQYCY